MWFGSGSLGSVALRLVILPAGFGCGWEHLPTATALEPSRVHLVRLLLGIVLACFTGDPMPGASWPCTAGICRAGQEWSRIGCIAGDAFGLGST